MMKRKVLATILFLMASLLYLGCRYFGKSSLGNPAPKPSPASLGAKVVQPKADTFVDDNKTYKYLIYQIEDLNKLFLFANFKEKISAKDFVSQNGCVFLTNAGFYTTDGNPTGLFVSHGKTYGNWNKNKLFNGVLSINDFAVARITPNVPSDNLELAVQSGPLLVVNAEIQKLEIKNDKTARRVVALTDGENNLYFMVVYLSNSLVDGPLLTDLPEIVSLILTKEEISVADSINLNGGSASTFYNRDFFLTELKSVGGFFCEIH